ncbi:MAG: STAS domain-containing protein [Negativicutes bacterium]
MIQVVTVTPKQIQVVLSGSIYAVEAKTIRESLAEYIDSGRQAISIDLSQIDYIDGNGIQALVFIHKRVMEKNGHLEIKGLQGNIKELFELVQLNKVLDIQ